jgi:hypothetical protein
MAEPPIRLVSEQSEADIAKKRAEEEIGIELRALAANLLRVIRGAGKAYDLARDMSSCLKAFQVYYDTHNVWPDSYRLEKALDFDPDEYSRLKPDMDEAAMDQWQIKTADNEVCRAALQIVASKLIGQRTQEHQGHSDLYSAIRSLDESREKRRARYAAEARPTKPPKRKKKPGGGPDDIIKL